MRLLPAGPLPSLIFFSRLFPTLLSLAHSSHAQPARSWRTVAGAEATCAAPGVGAQRRGQATAAAAGRSGGPRHSVATVAAGSMSGQQHCYPYPRPALTVDAIIVAQTAPPQLLLIQRKHNPFAGSWALPGGFVDSGACGALF